MLCGAAANLAPELSMAGGRPPDRGQEHPLVVPVGHLPCGVSASASLFAGAAELMDLARDQGCIDASYRAWLLHDSTVRKRCRDHH